jgi:cytosine/adenosine deaminase-related metal-dependent hydrolase
MAFEPAVAVFDACILYPFHLRNIIVQAAVDRLVAGRWTDQIHDEWIRNLAADIPAIPLERLQTTRQLMMDALPDALVSGYQNLIATVNIPDSDDRHVIAAAIKAGASVVLTWNLRDFPATTLTKHGLRIQTPDTFLAELHDQEPDLMVGSLANARRNLSKSRVSASDFVDILDSQQLGQLAKRVRRRLTDL